MEARKAESEFPWVHTNVQHPACRPLRTLQKGSSNFRPSPNAGIKKGPHPMIFPIFPSSRTPTNSFRLVVYRG